MESCIVNMGTLCFRSSQIRRQHLCNMIVLSMDCKARDTLLLGYSISQSG